MFKLLISAACLLVCLTPTATLAYPIDGEEESGIRRLEGFRLAQQAAGGPKLVSGQLWSVNDVKLHLIDYKGPDFDTLPVDPELSTALNNMLGKRDPSYSMVLVDFTDVDNIRWAGLRPDIKQNPGSVGKLLCMAALFHTLSEVFPDPEQRAILLKTVVTKAGDWVTVEQHKVPKWSTQEKRNIFSVINPKDEFTLSEWLDHAISASANGAGAILWREAMLVRHFGEAYPVSDQARVEFFAKTPKAELSALAKAVITEPLIQAGMNTDDIQQGSSFTSAGKNKVPGTVSFATPRELARLLFRIEQGKLVDAWSSLQMKKYMYLTKRRYRYSYAPELNDQAIFFKSGSLYSCTMLPGSKCGKYMGDKQNLMNSVAIIEGPKPDDPHYIAALMTNVLQFNSAWDHSRIGAAVDVVIRTRKPQALKENASAAEISDSGRSD